MGCQKTYHLSDYKEKEIILCFLKEINHSLYKAKKNGLN